MPRLVWPLGPFEDWPHQLFFTKVDSTAPPLPPPPLRPHDCNPWYSKKKLSEVAIEGGGSQNFRQSLKFYGFFIEPFSYVLYGKEVRSL